MMICLEVCCCCSQIQGLDNVEKIREKYDLIFYIGNEENASNKTVTRIKWNTVYGLGNNTPWFAAEVPTMFISLANPYHLIDVPMVRTYINAYSSNEYVINAVMEKIMGRSEFICNDRKNAETDFKRNRICCR